MKLFLLACAVLGLAWLLTDLSAIAGVLVADWLADRRWRRG